MNHRTDEIARQVAVAVGREPADLVVKNAAVYALTTGETRRGDIAIAGDRIAGIGSCYSGKSEFDGSGMIAVPGFIDTHVHLESTMVTPYEFDRLVVPHGVTTAICDPHELANVAGTAAFDYFFRAAEGMVLDLYVQLSSCVPATEFDSGGAVLDAAALAGYLKHPKCLGQAEMMNIPGLLKGDPGVLEKLALVYPKPVDGHCPLVSGRNLNACLAAGIRNCHETNLVSEAMEKIEKGMTLLIREGSVGRNLDALIPLLTPITAGSCAFCTDDRDPFDIHEKGHIDYMIRRAIELGGDPLSVYRAATVAAARSFGLRDRGLIAPGYRADIALLSDLGGCRIERMIAAGRLVDDALFASRPPEPPADVFRHSVKLKPVEAECFKVRSGRARTTVIDSQEGILLTGRLTVELRLVDGVKYADPGRDVLKLAVLARHGGEPRTGLGFVHGFGIRNGALASSVGHDSHNLCVVGANDGDMAVAVNALIECGGGFVAVENGKVLALLPLEIGGLISAEPFADMLPKLKEVIDAAHRLGCRFREPFQQLSFLPLPVIPHLRLTDRGLFDVDKFEFVREY